MKKKRARIFLALFSIVIPLVFVCGPGFLTAEKEALAADRGGYEDVFFKTPDSVNLHGRLIRSSAPKKGTVIFFHDYPEKPSDRTDDLLWLKDAGYDIFAFDYRGSGRSDGSPTSAGIRIDIAAAIETALMLADVKRDPVFILGQGLGGALAVYALANSAHKDSISGLIIDGSFASREDLRPEKLKTIAAERSYRDLLPGIADDSYSPNRWIDEISPIPVIIIHADADEEIPLRSGLKLYDRAKKPKELLIADGKGRAQALADMDIRKRLITYLDKVN